MNYSQIAILLSQGTLVSLLILLLFNLRKKLGIGVLFACLGLFQFMQVFLSSTIYLEITENFLVSPGPSVLFTATLFAILLIYIKEDASETRKIIYALLITNVVMSFLIYSFNWNIKDASVYNPFNVSTKLFDNNSWILFVGTIALFLDSLLIIKAYEFISRKIPNLFLKVIVTMLIVIGFDTLFFSYLAFWNYDNLNTILVSGMISKGFFAFFYSIIFYVYLKYFEIDEFKTNTLNIKDVFEPLTFRQKYEIIKQDVIKTSEEAKLKENKYKTLTTISPVGIFHTRTDGYTTFVNPRWCEISGLSMDEAIGDGWLKAVYPDDIEPIKNEWNLATSQTRESETQYRFLLNDGSIRWVLGRAVPEFNNQGQIIGYIGTITDITSIIQFQKEQILLKEKAEESDRLKSAFLANMSHEIRTPMNGILSFANLLRKPDLTNEIQQKYVQLINRSGERMLNIINDIVNISKIESGIIDLNTTRININETIQFVYDSLKPSADNKNLNLSFKCALPNNEATTKTDSEKLMGILSNLVKNAIKYTDSGSVELGYTKENNAFRFYVKDTGIGISEEKREAIFERFIQADITNRMARQGAGLGLAITKAYVEVLGGTIWVESKETVGSTFFFTLPFNNEPEINTSANYPSDNKEQYQTRTSPSLKVLIAEDDKVSELALSIIMKRYSKQILKAHTGLEAVEICRNNPDIDLVLMDIQMPEMNGYQATMEIRKFNTDVVIIAQTAYAIAGDKEKAIAAGCNTHIAKPINPDELNSLISMYFKLIEH